MKSGQNHTAAPFTLIVLAGATLLASLGISIATIALPTLARTFPAALGQLQWVALAYLLAMTVTIVSAGRLADLYGHRRVLLAGLGLFTLGSLLCALSPTLWVLIGARALAGVGAAVLVAIPMSIARDVVSPTQTGSIMGLLGSMSAIGTALGPSLGGLLIANAGWQSAFGMLTSAALALLMLALRALPTTPPKAAGQTPGMDWRGTLLLTTTLGSFALVTTSGGPDTFWSSAALLLVALLALGLFVTSQLRSPSPLIPLPLLRDPGIALGLAMSLMVGAIMMSTLVLGPYYLSFALGLDAGTTGLVMAAGPAIAALAGAPAGRLADRIGVQRAVALALAEIALGLVGLATLPLRFGVVGYGGALLLLTPGFQLFLAANNAGVMLMAPQTGRGVLSGLLGLSRNLGLLSGASVAVALFTGLVGNAQIDQAPVAAISAAFSTSFLLAAIIVALSTLLTTSRVRRALGRH